MSKLPKLVLSKVDAARSSQVGMGKSFPVHYKECRLDVHHKRMILALLSVQWLIRSVVSRMNLSAYFEKIFSAEKDTAAVQTFQSGMQAGSL